MESALRKARRSSAQPPLSCGVGTPSASEKGVREKQCLGVSELVGWGEERHEFWGGKREHSLHVFLSGPFRISPLVGFSS